MSRSDLFDELSTTGVLREGKTAAIVHQVGYMGSGLGTNGGGVGFGVGGLGVYKPTEPILTALRHLALAPTTRR